MARPALATSPVWQRWLARWRVPLGFAAALVAFVFARPTRGSLVAGGAVAVVGEAIRVWAAGHLEKSREVTTSGPYRWLRHPLYVGSSVIGLGVAVAAASLPIALLVAVYLSTTITSAIRTEEAYLRPQFGESYERYAAGLGPRVSRRFSAARVIRNKEYRAISGVAAGFVLLAVRAWFGTR
jgi:protein-S-isoprenylcysteine O-methyltransferase Ste14